MIDGTETIDGTAMIDGTETWVTKKKQEKTN